MLSRGLTLEKLQQFWWEVLPHPLYSPELSPYDYNVFKPMKEAHEGHRFDMDAGVQEPITLWFHQQPQDFYRHGIDRLIKLWDVCLNNHGAYAK